MMLPGPGDPETWGAPRGHPHDPRTEDEECVDYEPDYEAMAYEARYG